MPTVPDYMGTPEERFWRKVNKTPTCWLWTGATRNGYGAFSVNRKAIPAHRFAWELLVGPIPNGHVIDHDNPEYGCGNPACVNPAHLEPVPQGINNVRKRALMVTNISGHDGVSWSATNEKWRVRVRRNGKAVHGGYFTDLNKAAAVAAELRAGPQGSQRR